MAQYSVKAIANWFIKQADDKRQPIDQIKLMKLVYIAQGLSLAINGHGLFEEKIEAWKYGPVVASLYHELKYLGIEKITNNNLIIDETTLFDEHPKPYSISEDDKETEEVLKLTWQSFKEYSGVQLSNWSHNEDGPWYKEWHTNNGNANRNHPINESLIKSYFKEKLRENHA